jgi:hypothetical protein
MNEIERELFEKRLNSLAKGFEYPRIPAVAAAVMKQIAPAPQRRLMSRPVVWAFVFVLILFSSLMLIPPARAAIIEFIQIGVIRIFPRSTEIHPTPHITPAPASSLPSMLPLLNRISGETTLALAQQKVSFPILLPVYPDGLGEPDHVFVQDAEGTMIILVWMDPDHPEQVLLSLHFIPSGSWAINKVEPELIQETTVNGNRALWTAGPYALRATSGDINFIRLVEGHVLVWSVANVTYRLETALPLEEALKMAESLEPYSP